MEIKETKDLMAPIKRFGKWDTGVVLSGLVGDVADKDDYLFGIKFDGVENLVETMTKKRPGKGTPSKGKKIAYTKASPKQEEEHTREEHHQGDQPPETNHRGEHPKQ